MTKENSPTPLLRVLVVGPRRGLCRALRAQEIPFVVWQEKPGPRADASYVHTAPLEVDREQAQLVAQTLANHGPFTHVIAGTETAVIAAAMMRRLLDARRYPQSTVLRCRNKLDMKRHLAQFSVPMTDFLGGSRAPATTEIVERLGLPVVVKPLLMSGGRGIAFVRSAEELATTSLRGCILERYVDAPEASVESFIHQGEIRFENVTRYHRKTRMNIAPATFPGTTMQEILDVNRRVIDALDIRWGMTHLEVYLTGKGVLFGEVALRPPGGYIMDLLELAWGFDPWNAMVAMELDQPFEFPKQPTAVAGVAILHPGPGRIAKIEGVDHVNSLPSVVGTKLKVDVGSQIEDRTGVGRDVGRVLVRADREADVEEALDEIDAHLKFHMEV